MAVEGLVSDDDESRCDGEEDRGVDLELDGSLERFCVEDQSVR